MNNFYENLNKEIKENRNKAKRFYEKGLKSDCSKEKMFYVYEIQTILSDVQRWLQFPIVKSLLFDLSLMADDLYQTVDESELTQEDIRFFMD